MTVHLLWLLVIPVVVFFGAAAINALSTMAVNSGKWWSAPLYFAIAFPLAVAAVLSVMFFGFLAVT